MRLIIYSLSILFFLSVSVAGSSADTKDADAVSDVEMGIEMEVQSVDTGQEEVLCDLPLCPEAQPCPEPEPCPEAKPYYYCPLNTEGAAETNLRLGAARKHMDFLRDEVYFYIMDKSGKHVLDYLIEQLDRYLLTYRGVPGSEEALYLKARIYNKQREYEMELDSLLKLVYEYPHGPFLQKSRLDAEKLLNDRLKSDYKDNPDLLAGGKADEHSMNQVRLIEQFIKLSDDDYLDLQMREMDEFLAYYPRNVKADLVMTFKANNFVRRKNYDAAAHTYRHLVTLYPESPLRAESLYNLGLVYSEHLKKYKQAIETFEEIIEEHLETPQAISAHERAAELYDDEMDQPDNAIAMLNALAARFPHSDAALRGFWYMAEIMNSEDRYPEELKTYQRLAEMFIDRPEDAVKALFEAARVAHKRLDDYPFEVKILLGIYEVYPTYERSAEALYQAAQLYEDRLEQRENAKKYYRIVVDSFATHNLATKATSRLESIRKQEEKEELKRQKELEKLRKKELEAGKK